MMRNRLLLFACCTAFTALNAQISEGGMPLALQTPGNHTISAKMPKPVALPALNVEKAWQEDSQQPGQNRFAAPVPADVSLQNAGTWTTFSNGDRLWQCSVRSTGALGLVLMFDRFFLPPGSKLFAYTPDGKKVYGAYTNQSCQPSGKFLIGILPGDVAYIELFEPASVKGLSQLHLNRADYAYDQNAMNSAQVAGILGFGNGLPCNININCPQGNNWQTQKKGIARILMVFDNGSGWCSGSLVANTTGNYDPYFLTAHHCQIIGINPSFDMWRFDFQYESPDCNNPATEPTPKSVLGCQRVAFRFESDFMLLKINPIPVNYDLYFNGWTRSTTPATNNTIIHHPLGDIKKIAIDTNPAVIEPQTINWGGGFGVSPVNTHWKTVPDIGIFQPGSSGCPMLDQNKHIVGQLHGGNTTGNGCIVTNCYYGRFDISWNTGTTPDTRLKEWLDPGNTNKTTQDGYAQPIPSGFNIAGNVKTFWGTKMPGVKINLAGTYVASTVTDTSGNFVFANVPAAGSYTVTAVKDTNDLNGISTFDMVLMSKHILGIQSLDSPWKIIAADTNKNNSLTTADIVEDRKLILGLTTAFGANTSWRFFPSFLSFPNPLQPFQNGALPEQITITNLQATYSGAGFIGVKVGDTNASADPGQ